MDDGEPDPQRPTPTAFCLLPLAQACASRAHGASGGWQEMPEEQQSVLLNPGWPSSMRDNMKPTAEQFENFVAGHGARL